MIPKTTYDDAHPRLGTKRPSDPKGVQNARAKVRLSCAKPRIEDRSKARRAEPTPTSVIAAYHAAKIERVDSDHVWEKEDNDEVVRFLSAFLLFSFADVRVMQDLDYDYTTQRLFHRIPLHVQKKMKTMRRKLEILRLLARFSDGRRTPKGRCKTQRKVALLGTASAPSPRQPTYLLSRLPFAQRAVSKNVHVARGVQAIRTGLMGAQAARTLAAWSASGPVIAMYLSQQEEHEDADNEEDEEMVDSQLVGQPHEEEDDEDEDEEAVHLLPEELLASQLDLHFGPQQATPEEEDNGPHTIDAPSEPAPSRTVIAQLQWRAAVTRDSSEEQEEEEEAVEEDDVEIKQEPEDDNATLVGNYQPAPPIAEPSPPVEEAFPAPEYEPSFAGAVFGTPEPIPPPTNPMAIHSLINAVTPISSPPPPPTGLTRFGAYADLREYDPAVPQRCHHPVSPSFRDVCAGLTSRLFESCRSSTPNALR